MRRRDAVSISYALQAHFVADGSPEPTWRAKMAHRLLDECSDLPSGNDGRSHQSIYRFGRGEVKRDHGRSVLNRINRYLKALVEEIGDAKLRRMRREVELRGVCLDQAREAWIASSLRDRYRGD
jgi:hypothetical protein